MSTPDLVVPVDVAVVDPDLLWRVEVMNALEGLMVKDVVTVFGAMSHLTHDHPAVIVLGPGAVADSSGQLAELRAGFPGVRVLGVDGFPGEYLDEYPAEALGEGPDAGAAALDASGRQVPTAPVGGSRLDPPRRALRLVPDPDHDREPDREPGDDRDDRGDGRADVSGPTPSTAGIPVATDPVAIESDELDEPDASDDSRPAREERSTGPVGVPSSETPNAAAASLALNRLLPAGSTLDDVVVAVHQELAAARSRAAEEADSPGYKTLAQTQVIVVTSAKGGDGATTVAANLAAILAGQGRGVGLVEGDPVFGDLALVLALPTPAGTIARDPETGVRLVVPTRSSDAFEPVDVDRLLDQITTADPPFEVVVIEAPATIVHRSGLGRMADHLLVVCSAHLSSIKNAVILIDVLDSDDNLAVVVNRVGRKGLPRHELEGALRAHVVAQLPIDSSLEPARADEAPELASTRSGFVKELTRLVDALCPAIHRS